MNKQTLKTLALVGSIVLFVAAAAATAYGVYKWLEKRKEQELDYYYGDDYFDDDDDVEEAEA